MLMDVAEAVLVRFKVLTWHLSGIIENKKVGKELIRLLSLHN
jgi:hypothetical protein